MQNPPGAHLVRLSWILQLNLQSMDLFDLGIQNADEFHFLPLETSRQYMDGNITEVVFVSTDMVGRAFSSFGPSPIANRLV
jgi:hypothetical protein